MKKKSSFRDYLFKLKHVIVAPKLLGILHLITQISIVVWAIVAVIDEFSLDVGQGFLWLLIALIAIPLCSLVVRFLFEMFAVPFTISKNLAHIKKLFFGEDWGSCCGECEKAAVEMETSLAEPVLMKVTPLEKTPTKKASMKKSSVKKWSETISRRTTKTPAKKSLKKTT